MYGKIKEHLQQELDAIKAAGLYKTERVIESPQRAEIDVAGKKVLNFKAKRRKGYRRLVGHRQSITVATVKAIA